MKNYIKIFLITLAIQLGGSVVGVSISFSSSDIQNMLGNILFCGCVPLAIIVDIILAIRWGSNIKQKLIYIFLMPTNYIWLVCLFCVFWHVSQWIDMLSNIYR